MSESEKKSVFKKTKNHSGHHEEHEEGEPWLLSYADMVTLLMCFFILFFSIDKSRGGISDPERLKTKLESLIKVEIATSQSESARAKSEESGSSGNMGSAQKLSRKIKEDLRNISKAAKIVFSMSTPEQGVIELTFLNSDFFGAGKANITQDGIKTVKSIVGRLKNLSKGVTIAIEGHTDSDVIRHSVYVSNWELSSARAAAVARLLVSEGVDPKMLMVAGFGEHKPILPEIDAQGRINTIAKKMNRRIVVRVRLPKEGDGEENDNKNDTDKIKTPALNTPEEPRKHTSP